MALLRCLNDKGIEEFKVFLDRLRSGSQKQGTSALSPSDALLLDSSSDPSTRLRNEILNDIRYSHEFPLGDVGIESRDFSSRGEFARYLDECLISTGIVGDVDEHGMWEWLSLFYIDVVCPDNQKEGGNIGDDQRYIGRRSHRHLLRDPYMLYRQYKAEDSSLVDLVLCYPVFSHSYVVEEICARSRIRNSTGALKAARNLFFDDEKSYARRGVTTRPNGVRDYCQFLQNLPAEYDLTTISADTVLYLLPQEFDTWLDSKDAHQEVLRTRDIFGVYQHDEASGTQLGTHADAESIAQALENLDSNDRDQISVNRYVRSDHFRIGVLKAYENRCAVSGIGLIYQRDAGDVQYEVQAAHIRPVAREGRDLIENGLALNRSIHWAFDLGMIWIDADLRVKISHEAENDRRNEWLKGFANRKLNIPSSAKLHPSNDAITWHRKHVAGVDD